MTTEVRASVALQGGLQFQGSASSGATVQLNPASDEQHTGLTPMELVLVSLASCSAMDVVSILRKKRQPVDHLDVHVCGTRRDEYPTVYTAIALEFIVHGSGVEPAAVARAIELAETRYCPVWAMLGVSVPITATFRVECDEPATMPVD